MDRVFVAGRGTLVAAIAEETQVSGRQPVQEVGRLGDFLRRPGRETGTQLGGHHGGGPDQRARIGDDGADRFQRLVQRGLDRLGPFRVRQSVDQDVDPRFPDAVLGIQSTAGLPRHGDEVAVTVPAHREDRMQHPVHGHSGRGDRADHGLDHVLHVVIDDVDHGGGRGPAAGAFGSAARIEDAQGGYARLASPGHPQVAVHHLEDVLRVPWPVLFGHMSEVGPDQRFGLGTQSGGQVHRTRLFGEHRRTLLGRSHRLHFLHLVGAIAGAEPNPVGPVQSVATERSVTSFLNRQQFAPAAPTCCAPGGSSVQGGRRTAQIEGSNGAGNAGSAP